MTGGLIGNVDLVKQLNNAAVYRLIDHKGSISRIQIAELSQLAPASITKITRQLLEYGLIKEVEQQASTGGRRAVSLTTITRPFHSVAVRVGRNYLHIGLYDLSGKQLIDQQYRFQYQDQSELLHGLIARIEQFISHYHTTIKPQNSGKQSNKKSNKNSQQTTSKLIAMAVVLPGLINPETGIVSYMPHTKIDQFPLRDELQKHFELPCFVGNDIRGLALAEHYFGISKDCLDSLVVSVHNGTGSGMMVNGQVFLGNKKNVGEIGHIQVEPLGDRCQCGQFGCLETIASNPAIIARIKNLLAQGYPSSLANIYNQNEQDLTIETICQHANKGDELAMQVLERVGDYLGRAIALTINLFNPEKVVIAGDIMLSKAIIFQAIQYRIKHHSLPSFHQDTQLVASQLQNFPAIGAFAMIKRAMLDGVLLQKLLDEQLTEQA